MVYDDCLRRSLKASSPIPLWYLLEDKGEIIGCCGIITNDFISCMDLYPWICALYIEEASRGNSFGKIIIDKCIEDTKKLGYNSLYLSNSHIGYYEKYGFKYICDGYHPWGESSRFYEYIIK
ncbi:GNAT family N-acetyltransferase [Miniphocaeibacter massiliensis]|uniref:GNAT family N-acetyltransferase n=1 Tax=Miniphocaeibacter massiliensis TaxID=2041841 RepID=UPI001F5D56AE|nr:GNAT family N-acetyltransferase [Miniphocaeibacter massiliensis]